LIAKRSDILGRVEKSIEIKAPPEKVWEMLALDRFPEWDEGTQKDVKSVEYTTEVRTPEDKYRVGAIAHMNRKKGEGIDFEITESLENEKIAYLLVESRMSAILTYLLEPVEEGTKLTYAMDYKMPWGIFGKFLDRLFGQRIVKKEFKRSLENLKSILEK
jgi:uncharacterized membrane protein